MSAAEYGLDDMRTDASDAFNRAQRYHAELREIYKFFMPWRLPTTERAGSPGQRTEGQSLGSEMVFDSSGLSACANFVANMQADWMPRFEPLFKLEAGPLYTGANGDAGDFNKKLQVASNIVHAFLGPTRLAGLEALQDLFAGTGAMFMGKGKANGVAIPAVAVPTVEMAMENGPWGTVERWFWKRHYKARHVPELWADAKIGDKLARLIKDNRNADVEVTQYTHWCPKTERYQLRAWTPHDDTMLRTDSFAETPWITPRLFVVPGESFGRGLAHLALPTMKSLNKARELALRAAAFALLGLWIRRHDGVFNPDTAVLRPGAFWKVAHTHGPLKSIEKLDIPANFDVSSIVIRDERDNLRRVLLDDDLPDMKDTVRTPTEIAARLRRYDRNRGGNTVRLAEELINPIAKRGVDVCTELGLLKGLNLKLDQTATQITVMAPAALAARSAHVERFTSWMQIIVGLFGPQAAMLAGEVEKAIPDLGRWLGVDESHIRSAGGTAELKDMIAQYVAQIQASEQAKAVQAKAMTSAPSDAMAPYRNGAM